MADDDNGPPHKPGVTTATPVVRTDLSAGHRPGIDPAALADAIRYEHSLTFVQAVKLYPAAIAWSVFVSVGVIMLAFDPQLLGNFFAMNQFRADFGYEFQGEVC
jgi:MFS transporter, SP family, general alpha glucoside:H+ symporter